MRRKFSGKASGSGYRCHYSRPSSMSWTIPQRTSCIFCSSGFLTAADDVSNQSTQLYREVERIYLNANGFGSLLTPFKDPVLVVLAREQATGTRCFRNLSKSPTTKVSNY
eukprot:scaffold2629_cov152-Amphora_coffeaeformis.AAC.10